MFLVDKQGQLRFASASFEDSDLSGKIPSY